MNLSQQRTRVVNPLHKLPRELRAGAFLTDLTAAKAAAAVHAYGPQHPQAGSAAADNQAAATRMLDEHGTRLRQIVGVRPCWRPASRTELVT
jgi:transposase